MADGTATWSEQHVRLRDAVLARLAEAPETATSFLHHRATVAEVVAHVIAAETVRTAAGRRAVDRDALGAADARMDEALALAGHILPQIATAAARLRLSDGAPGTSAVRRYDDVGNRIRCQGASGYVSPSFDGVMPHLPTMSADARGNGSMLRRMLSERAGNVGTIRRAQASSPADGRAAFHLPAPDGDPELGLEDYILDAAHISPKRRDDFAERLVSQVMMRDNHIGHAKGLRDEIRRIAETFIDGVDGLALDSIRLYRVNGPTKPNPTPDAPFGRPVFIFHVTFGRTDALLRHGTERIVVRSERGVTNDQWYHDALAKLVEDHTRHHGTARGRGVEWDAVALSLVRRFGAAPEDVIAALSENPNRARLRNVGGAWARVRNGRITLRAQISDGVLWRHDEIEISGTVLPRTAAMALAGRKGSEVVDDEMFADSVIRSVGSSSDGTIIRFKPRWVGSEEAAGGKGGGA